jgi:hypothetical protein
MNTDLIKKLESLTPTEGEWEDFYGRIETDKDVDLFDRIEANQDDCTLITLSPQMRIAILEMAKEIDELRNELRKVKIFRSTKKVLGDNPQPKIQMVTDCERFKQLNPNNDYCMNCGKSKYLHVNP